jgi:branched-chain amino acid transport system ATP-binding protein
MSTPILSLEQITASYGPFRALFGVDLEVNEGHAVGLLGANGSGKSTIARVISGLVPVDSGRLRIDGRDARRWPAERIRQAGIWHVPEGRGVFASLSVEENLKVALLAQPRRQRSALLAQLFDRFELLAERRRDRAGTLSGGQQRLLALAPAFVVPPRLLLADELSLGLAPNILDELYASLADLRAQGTTLLITEQHIDRILNLVDTACVVEHGRIIHAGPPDQALAVLEASLASGGRGAESA